MLGIGAVAYMPQVVTTRVANVWHTLVCATALHERDLARQHKEKLCNEFIIFCSWLWPV